MYMTIKKLLSKNLYSKNIEINKIKEEQSAKIEKKNHKKAVVSG